MASLRDTLGRTRQSLLLGVGFIILVAIGTATAWLVGEAADDAAVIARSLRVQATLAEVLLSTRRAESSQRGYLFTDQQSYLDDYGASRPELRQRLAELSALSEDNPARLAQIAEITRLVDAKFAEMDRTVQHNTLGRRDEARTEFLAGEGRRLANQIRQLITDASADETRILADQAERAYRNHRLLLFVSVAGAALVILIGALSVYLVQRNRRQADAARTELETTNENLERIVEYRTTDLKEANDEIQRFAYIVSHDLRSPLVNIMGFTSELEALRKDLFEHINELQRRLDALGAQATQAAEPVMEGRKPADELSHEFDEALGFIKTSIAKMDRLINAMLKLSREGRREFRPETIDMDTFMDSISRSVAHRASELGATVSVGGLPDVESDRLALEQIFGNLVDNALKYLRDGEPGRVEITGRSNAIQVIYDVTDNGRGIDERDHQRVFELFRRAGAQDRPGEGIGLAHVRALVRRLGGHMSLKSELGKGSTFTVTLPRRWSVDRRSVA